MQKYKLCLDPQAFRKKPTKKQTGKITNRIVEYEYALTLAELAKAIGKGQTWCPATFFGNKRNKESFLEQQLLVADIDSFQAESTSLDELVQESGLRPNIIHESFSSTSDSPKYRLVFALDEPIELQEEVALVTKYIAMLYNGDFAVCEGSRLLYGTNKRVELKHEKLLDSEQLLDMAMKVVPKPEGTSGHIAGELNATSIQELYQQLKFLPALHKGALRGSLQDVAEWVANPDIKGSGYETVFKSAVHLALLSFLPDWAIEDLMLQELEKHQSLYGHDNWQHAGDAGAIIQKAIQWGKALEPRY